MTKWDASCLDSNVFYHATDIRCAQKIAEEGFRVWFDDKEIGRFAKKGNLGIGVYMSRDWRWALVYGQTLLKVKLRRGTRLLTVDDDYDERTIEYLVREFGKEVLRSPHGKSCQRTRNSGSVS